MLKVIQVLMFVTLFVNCMAEDFRKYIVYYVPLNVHYYVPPSREDIMKWGVRFEIHSPVLDGMYEAINVQNGEKLTSNDCSLVRILIINNAGREVLITQDKTIISIQDNKKYILDAHKVDEILHVITNVGDDLLKK